ncbi:MAG: C-terminal binding protein [Desulfobacterales bacterium]|nr:MAG: C-terminal binding protein [Desulfobacterales bacterium]
MPGFKIVFTDYYYPHNEIETAILKRLGQVEIIDCTKIEPGGILEEDRIIPYLNDADAVIVQFAEISRKVVESLTQCRIIARYAIGVDNIDVQAARQKGIVVANVPDYCIEEVSDTAIAHMLNCVRKVSYANDLLHRNQWSYAKIKPIRRFADLTVGLLAFGNIARRVAEKLKSFRVRTLAFDPYFAGQEYGWVEFVALKELLSQADIVSIHAPLNNETHHLMDAEKFSWLKKGAMMVNSSRGGLIDEPALRAALESDKLSMIGLDVLDCQDTEYYQSALLQYPDRVFITPHMGWYSEEAIVDLQTKTALNVYEMLKNGQPLYAV